MNASRIKAKAKELGFELVGIAPAQPVPDYDFFRWWLDQGFAGTMDYLRRNAVRRGDPERVLPGVRSVVCCGINYYHDGSGTPISRYAQGRDYHAVLVGKLKDLEKFIRREIDPNAATKSYVDTGPVLERSYAAQAGLGWIGKNTCLVNNGIGSFCFLGEVLTTLKVEYDRPALDQCGSCTKCLEACPTGALPEPYLLDARRCLSYLTIEYRGPFTDKEKERIGPHLFGCDICQEVCPYNDRISISPLPEFQGAEVPCENTTKEEFHELTKGSAMERISFAQWRRNLNGCGHSFSV